jgi:hypothetical protein
MVSIALGLSPMCMHHQRTAVLTPSAPTALLASTLLALGRGETSIDVARRKAVHRQAAAAATTSDALLQTQRIEAVSHFWVPFPDDGRSAGTGETGVVLPTLPHERPYDLGSRRDNVRTALGCVNGLSQGGEGEKGHS